MDRSLITSSRHARRLGSAMAFVVALAASLGVSCAALAGDEGPLASIDGFSFPTQPTPSSAARNSFGHSAVSIGPWLFVGSTGEIYRYHRIEVDGRSAFVFDGVIPMPSPPGFHIYNVGMWLAASGSSLFAGRGKLPSGATTPNYSTSDIAHFSVSAEGEPTFVGWLGTPTAGIVRTDGATLVAPLPQNGWPAAPSTPGIMVCPLSSESTPGEPIFVPVPNATTYCRTADVSGSWIAVGVPEAEVYGLEDVGRVAILHRDERGGWSLHQWITPPISMVSESGRFGEAVAIDGTTLVVGAPRDKGPTPSLVGGAAVYTIGDDGLWTLRHQIAPLSGSDYTGGAVEVEGEFIAVGAMGKYSTTYSAGNARLFRLTADALEPLSTVLPYATDPNVGRALWFTEVDGERFWMVSSGPRDLFSGSLNEFVGGSVVHVRSLDAIVADCDADGLADGPAIDAGLVADCDGNRVPDGCEAIDCDRNSVSDRCEVLPIPVYEPTAAVEFLYRQIIRLPPTGVMVILRSHEIPEGSTGVLDSVQLAIGRLTAGASVTLVFYADPNQDGVPDDATLVAAEPIAITTDEALPATFHCAPTVVGSPGTRFFAGVVLEGGWVNQTFHAVNGPSESFFYLEENVSTFDITVPTANAAFVDMAGSGNATLRPALTPRFRTVVDVNGDRVPDSCACPADLDRSGTVDASDLAVVLSAWGTAGEADIDGDGTVGAFDLAVVLSMWGGC
jgi:hypothetical protein